MKKNTLLILCCFISVFISCNKDDDGGKSDTVVTVTEDLLLGKWYFVDQVVNGVSFPYDDHEDCGKDYIEFKEDGTMWQVDVWVCQEDSEQLGGFSILDGELIIDGETFNVVKLTSNEFSIGGEEDYDGDGQLDEVISNFDR